MLDVLTKGFKDSDKVIRKPFKFLHAKYLCGKIANPNFSIIANNCTAGWIYQKFMLPYLTPTVGLFFYSDDYIKFLENFQEYVKSPLRFKNDSKYLEAVEFRKKKKHYPIGIIGDDVEIHFLHYTSEEEAQTKWNKRALRINFNNLFFIFSDRDNFEEEYFKRYEKIPYGKKIFFSSKPRNSEIVVFIKDYLGQKQVGESSYLVYDKYFDILKWLNGEPFLKQIEKKRLGKS